MFYVYEYYNIETLEVFYVGKGVNNKYRVIFGRNKLFLKYYYENLCDVRIVKYFEQEDDAFEYEQLLITKYKQEGQCKCNLDYGGLGGVAGIWTEEKRKYQSINNPMKDESQRQRMIQKNPIHKQEVVNKAGISKHGAISFYNKIYYTYKSLADTWGISASTVSQSWSNRLELIQKIIPNPINQDGPYTQEEKNKIQKELTSKQLHGKEHMGTLFTIFNVTYNSINQAAKVLGASRDTVKRWKEDEEKILQQFPELLNYNNLVPKEIKNKIIARNNKSFNMKKAISIDGTIYDSATDASKILNINANTIRSRCKSLNFPTYYFLYDDQQPSYKNSNNSIIEGSTTNE